MRKTTSENHGLGYEMKALLQALTYGKRAPILEVLQENNQQSLDTADPGISESKMMPSLQQRRKVCGRRYFLK